MTDTQPTLGIIGLDWEGATEGSSADRGAVTPFLIDDPSFWQVPFHSAIAKGADAVANKVPTPEAANGIVDAASRLDGQTQLIIGDCGYMWASREHLYGKTATPTVTSGLELLDLALRMTNRPVGIITWDAEPLVPLLRDNAGWERLRLLSVSDLPDWKQTIYPSDCNKPGGWTKERMAEQLSDRLAEAFAEGGVFDDVAILVVECTMVPDFRQTIRAVTPVPVLDLVHFAKAALE